MLKAKCKRGRVTIEYGFNEPSEIYADISTILLALVNDLEGDGLTDVRKKIAAAATLALITDWRAGND